MKIRAMQLKDMEEVVGMMRVFYDSPAVIATGGLAKSIVPYCKEDVILDDDLLLKGLLWVYKKNS